MFSHNSSFLLNRSMLMSPFAMPPSAWMGHIPFAAWLVEMHQPKMIVELGTHAGASFFAFCQAVIENQLTAKCFAVDTWVGDEHAGYYGEDMFREVSEYHDAHYSSFSRLLRMSFDESLSQFEDSSLDLLHIDGLHTYEAVKHDFETWLPKMSDQGIILFHDTQVRERGFGVWQLWQEVSGNYPHFEFIHAYGLGVLLVGRKQTPELVAFASLSHDDKFRHLTQSLFARLGLMLELEKRVRSYEKEIDALKAECADRHASLLGSEQQLTQMRDSTSWKITSPLRSVGNLVRKAKR